jgi:aldose sugar dehydrogenase
MRSIVALAAALLPIVAAPAAAQVFPSSAGDLKVETVAGGLVHPWSLAFLPDGRMLVSERPGRLRIVTRGGQLSAPLAGVPEVYTQTQAGLMDVMLGRDFNENHTVYFCYAERADGGGGRVAVARARLQENGRTPRLVAVTVIFRQHGPASRGYNIGCRMVQAPDGNLFVTLGDHLSAADMAQTLDNHIGKIVRITPDGKAPLDNPFVGKPGALPEIWAYGLRNAEGLAFNPADGKLWEQEHGPRGGDEINIIEEGKNYGWPKVSFGVNYDGTPVGNGKSTMPGVQAPVWHWTPSIAPSGMAFYTGDLFPAWKGSLINGALKFELLSRLELKGDKAVKEERLLQDLRERIRDVRQGPDGALYLLTDNEAGRILRISPVK